MFSLLTNQLIGIPFLSTIDRNIVRGLERAIAGDESDFPKTKTKENRSD